MKTTLTIIAVYSLLTVNAQDLYIPRNLKLAYENGTRSSDGKPGRNYWQNSARYAMHVKVSPPNRRVEGTEEIVYVNNSPEPLKYLVFKLFLNVHKPGAARLFPASGDYLTSGMHIDRYTEAGTTKPWTEERSLTMKHMTLNKPLQPHDSVKLSFDWHFDVSVESGREGAIDSTTFFLAYFYPRVAVLDDYNDWDEFVHNDVNEFYNDFNDYTFSVTAPKNYLVWATGELQNADDVLQAKYAERLKKSLTSDAVVNVATLDDLKGKQVTKDKDNTWKWKAGHVPDIAIAVSDHYVWDAASVVVDTKTGRRTHVHAGYDDRSQDYHQMVGFGQHALGWFSKNWPGIPYPYPSMSIIQGFGDMEYPMMVNDNTQSDPEFTRFVAEHEIAHTWFPFYMGINETRYGCMDEGWATFLEYLIGVNDVGKDRATKLFQTFRVKGWIKDTSQEEDVPIITPGTVLGGVTLGNNQYGKAALGYHALKDLLGDELFRKGLHTFMQRWNGKHPSPWDMFYSFNAGTEQNLNWFWHNWFFTTNYIDLSINKVTTGSKGTTLIIDNIGGWPAPFDVEVTYEDGSRETFHQTPAVWRADQKKTQVKLGTTKKVASLKLEGGIFMDANEKDNVWRK